MSMSLGGGGESDIPKAEINVTPLADVMLVLLIIFMITAPLMSHKIKVELPRADPKTKPTTIEVPPIDLAVQADGSLYWNDVQYTEAEFNAQVHVAATQVPQPALNIRADQQTPWRVVKKLMQEAKDAGMVHMGFITAGKAKQGG